MTTIKLSCKK